MTSTLKDNDSLIHGVARGIIMKSCMSECFVSHIAPYACIYNVRIYIVVVVSDEE